jgi:hypothetical protein
MDQPQRQHPPAFAFEPARKPLQQGPFLVKAAEMHRRTVVPQVAHHDGALLADNRQRPVARSCKATGQARGHAGPEGQASDGKSGAIAMPAVPGPLSGNVNAEKAWPSSTAPNSDTSQDRP